MERLVAQSLKFPVSAVGLLHDAGRKLQDEGVLRSGALEQVGSSFCELLEPGSTLPWAVRHDQVRCSDQQHTTEPSVLDAVHEDAPDH
eukprot:2182945-Alexandrium_andersonii.AAC.1